MKKAINETVWDTTIVLLGCAVILTAALGAVARRTTTVHVAAPHILVDAGHGGEDGGAVASDGTLEKDLNLAVACSLRDLLRVMGYRVSMTRQTDTMVNTEGTTQRERKVSDMKNRLSMTREADVTVSIHQNKFPQTQYYGAQVFYGAGHPDSAVFAERVRASLVELTQPDNTRPLKKADKNVYLLFHATTPTVLVECGFLSNAAELSKLKDSEYQRKLAFAVAKGVMKET